MGVKKISVKHPPIGTVIHDKHLIFLQDIISDKYFSAFVLYIMLAVKMLENIKS